MIKFIRLSAVLIVKNESSCLERCLQTLKGFDEIIVCDTGSQDNTIDIAKKYTDKVVDDYKWNDSFCEARNHALSKATGDFVLSIDADEELLDSVDEVKKVISGAEEKGVKTINVTQVSKTQSNVFPRLFKRCPEVYWRGAIHNYLSLPAQADSDIKIRYHYSEAHKKDPDRTLRILKKEVDKGGKVRELYYLAREYWYRKDYITAIYWYDEYLAVSKFLEEKADAYLTVARCYWALKKGDTARNYCLMALNINANFKEALNLMAEISWEHNAKTWRGFAKIATNKNVLFVRNSKLTEPTEPIEVCFLVYQRPERVPEILKQLKAQTIQNFKVNIWNNSGKKLDISSFPKDKIQVINSKENVGSQARFKLAKKTKGNPIIFFDDDENPNTNFIEYHYNQYLKFGKKSILGYFTRTFTKEEYWKSVGAKYGEEVDYIATKAMILDREIIDKEPLLQDIPEPFTKTEDLYLFYLARTKHWMRLVKIEPASSGMIDNKDQYIKLIDYKEIAFKELRKMGWWFLKDDEIEIQLKDYNKKIWVDTSLKNNDITSRGFLKRAEFYEKDLLEFASKLKLDKNKAIVDVGANIGNHTMFFSLFCPYSKIFSFEPYDKVRKVLENNIRMNKLKNIDVFPYAVGDKEGMCDLDKSPGGWDGRTSVIGGNSIKMVTLDDILKDEPVSLIKMDVEGYEYNVLLGAENILKTQHPYLFIEAKTSEIKKRIDDYLTLFGYKCKEKFNPPSPTYFYEYVSLKKTST